MSHLWGFVDGSHFCSDAQGDVCVLRVSAVQVAHPLTARLPPEVQEAVSNGVVLKHDVVYMSVFLGGGGEEKLHSHTRCDTQDCCLVFLDMDQVSLKMWKQPLRRSLHAKIYLGIKFPVLLSTLYWS